MGGENPKGVAFSVPKPTSLLVWCAGCGLLRSWREVEGTGAKLVRRIDNGERWVTQREYEGPKLCECGSGRFVVRLGFDGSQEAAPSSEVHARAGVAHPRRGRG